ncbi:MAG: carbamoyl phosphate synthase small subunit, partial [Thermaerobacter sp.]|nr:carbamoyl phosphate synthase small subunit [Thermaerobacter sp.]
MSLILEDGQVFRGEGHGRVAAALGEVVFTTAMTGYQEVLTDPSYAGQIVVMTYPLIGNYGVDPAAEPTECPRVRGVVVRELCDHPSHSRSTQTLTAYLERHGVPVLAGVDTRALTRRLRINGT